MKKIKVIVLGLIFAVSFVLLKTGIQMGAGMVLTGQYVSDLINAHETTAADTAGSRVEFGVQPSALSAQNIIVWLLSLGFSSGIVYGVHKYAFRK